MREYFFFSSFHPSISMITALANHRRDWLLDASGNSFAADASPSQLDLFQEEEGHQADHQDDRVQNKDIMEALHETCLHCLNHLIEERQALPSLRSKRLTHLYQRIWREQHLGIAEGIQNLCW